MHLAGIRDLTGESDQTSDRHFAAGDRGLGNATVKERANAGSVECVRVSPGLTPRGYMLSSATRTAEGLFPGRVAAR